MTDVLALVDAGIDDVVHGLPFTLYTALAGLARRLIGLTLDPAGGGRQLMWSRLRPRIAELGCGTFAAYLTHLERDAGERQRFAELLCTHETRFYREPEHFTFLAETLAPAWRASAAAGRRARRVRVWSAACSTGEEPFTLAMVLRQALPAEQGWAIEVLATDVSTRVLEHAAGATWSMDRAGAIPPSQLRQHMLCGFGDRTGTFRANAELRSVVRFHPHNLLDSPPGGFGSFDVVMCRNALIYFPRAEHAALAGRLLERLVPGGHLMVGLAESLTGMRSDLHGVQPSVYRYVPPGERRHG